MKLKYDNAGVCTLLENPNPESIYFMVAQDFPFMFKPGVFGRIQSDKTERYNFFEFPKFLKYFDQIGCLTIMVQIKIQFQRKFLKYFFLKLPFSMAPELRQTYVSSLVLLLLFHV